MYDNYPDDVEDLVREDKQRKAYSRHLMSHPDPRDPDYPEPEDYGLTYNEDTDQLEFDY